MGTPARHRSASAPITSSATGPSSKTLLGVGDRRPGGPNRGDERGKDLLTVQKQLHVIASDDRRTGVGLEGRVEAGLSELDPGEFGDVRIDMGTPGQKEDASDEATEDDHQPQSTIPRSLMHVRLETQMLGQ